MYVIDQATRMTVIRPVLCNDKNDTLNLARKIGTYELSKGPELCSLLGPKHPATTSKLDTIEFEEGKIDMGSMVDEALSGYR